MALTIEKKFGLADYRWVDGTDETWGEGISLKIRRWDNRDYEAYRNSKQVGLMGPVIGAALKKSFDKGAEVDFNVSDDVVRNYTSKDFEGVALHVLVDWQGIREIDEHGEESAEDVPYSYELGLQLLSDNPKLWELVVKESQDQQKYRDEFLASIAKN